MSDRAAASIGMVLAGFALAAGYLPWTVSGSLPIPGTAIPWSLVAVACAGVALVAFALRRYGVLDRSFGAALALGASAAVVVAAAVAVVLAVRQSTGVGTGVALATATGVGAVAAAYLDGKRVEAARIGRMGVAAVVALVLGLVGVLAGNVVGALPILLFPAMSTTVRYAVLTPLFGLVLGLVAFGFLSTTGRGLDYIDLRTPDRRDLTYIAGGTLLIFGLLVVLGALSDAIGLPSAQSGIVEQARQGDATVLLVLIPLSWLVIGPGEELLFRNVIQKYLYGPFSRSGAVVVACAVFAAMHALSYFTADTVALVTTLVRLFFLSLVLGVSYERTENLTVPVVIHGTFNALQFGYLYYLLSGGGAELSLLI